MLRFVKRAVFDFSAAVQNVTHVTHSLNYCTSREAPNPNVPLLVLLVLIQVIYVCMIYGPIAAYLVEAFPARIRYTSLSLPYHIGNGVFGGAQCPHN